MSDLIPYAAVFAASFVYVGLRAFQQKNVTGNKYAWVLPVAMMMAVLDVYLIATFASEGVGVVCVAAGLGAGLGCIAAMRLHDFIHRGKTR